MTRTLLVPLLLAPFLLPFGLSSALAIGSTLEVTEVTEPGSVFVPPAGTVTRYVTSLGPTLTFYESRDASGLLTGQILQAPDLGGMLPVVAPPLLPIFFEADGVTPFASPLFHPRLVVTETGHGLYAIDQVPVGTVHFFHSTDQGATWIDQGPLSTPSAFSGTGILGVITVPDPMSPGGFAVRLYHQGDGCFRGFTSRSHEAAAGLEKYTQQTMMSPALPGVMAGFTPTGGAFPLPDGGVGLFFVPQDDSYLGFAESPDGISWTITRGANAPVLSSSANVAAPDPAREEITEVSLIATANGFTGIFAGARPGQGATSRALGAFTIEFRTDFLRGDCNLDGFIDIADVFCQLGYLFQEMGVLCRDANDTNDDGTLDLSDPISTVQFLFAGGAVIPEPYPLCGDDPTADALTCFDVPLACP